MQRKRVTPLHVYEIYFRNSELLCLPVEVGALFRGAINLVRAAA